MKCNEVILNIDLLIDNVQNHPKYGSVKKHINDCESCHKEYLKLKAIVSAQNEIDYIEPPKSLKNAIFAKTINKQTNKNRWNIPTFIRAPYRYAAGFAAVVVLCVMLLNNLNEPETRKYINTSIKPIHSNSSQVITKTIVASSNKEIKQVQLQTKKFIHKKTDFVANTKKMSNCKVMLANAKTPVIPHNTAIKLNKVKSNTEIIDNKSTAPLANEPESLPSANIVVANRNDDKEFVKVAAAFTDPKSTEQLLAQAKFEAEFNKDEYKQSRVDIIKLKF